MPFQQLNSQLVTLHPLSHRLNDENLISYTGSLLLFFFKYVFSIFAYYFWKIIRRYEIKTENIFFYPYSYKIIYYYIILKDNYDGLLSNGRSLIHVIHLSLQVYIYTIQFILLKLDISEFLAR
jgi:hypothetical protein